MLTECAPELRIGIIQVSVGGIRHFFSHCWSPYSVGAPLATITIF
jgi:hypothetical protein